MDTTKILNHQDLTILIQQVRELKGTQDKELKENFTAFINSVNPIQVAKSTLHEFVKDKGVQFDLLKGGMNLGADYIIEKVFNKENSVKGFLSSVILENVSSALIQKNAPKIVIGITKFISMISNKINGAARKDEDQTEDAQTFDYE